MKEQDVRIFGESELSINMKNIQMYSVHMAKRVEDSQVNCHDAWMVPAAPSLLR